MLDSPLVGWSAAWVAAVSVCCAATGMGAASATRVAAISPSLALFTAATMAAGVSIGTAMDAGAGEGIGATRVSIALTSEATGGVLSANPQLGQTTAAIPAPAITPRPH